MPARIIDLTTVRLTRDLDAMSARARHLTALADRQRDACRDAASHLTDLRDCLDGFAAKLDHQRRRCEAAAGRLRRATEALESDDIDRMIAARDDLAHRMGPAGARACRKWPAVERRRL